MTSAHGNKTLLTAFGILFMAILLLLGGMISERKAKLKLYEKKYLQTVTEIQEKNQQAQQSQTGINNEIF